MPHSIGFRPDETNLLRPTFLMLVAERRYDDKEVGEILKSAAERQSGLAQSGTAEGLTLAELQSVAAEIGINPDTIGQVAGELDTYPKGRSRSKSDLTLIEKTIKGELSDEAWEDLVTEVRRFTGTAGKTEMIGNSREWVGGSETGSIVLSTTCRKGMTRLKLLGNTSGASALATSFGLAFGILVTISPVVVASKLPMNLFLVVVLCSLIAGLCIAATYGTIHANRKRYVGQMAVLLAKLAELGELSCMPDQSPTQVLGAPGLFTDSIAPVNQIRQFGG